MAPNWDSPVGLALVVMNLSEEAGGVTGILIIDYSGPSASHPLPSPGSYIDTVFPTISIVILDTIWVRHTAYPNPYESWFPHCPCEDTLCIDSLGEPLEFPYCGTKYIEWTPVDEQSILLSVNGYEYNIASPGMHWIDDSLLVFNTGEAGLEFTDGDTIHVCLEEATDKVTQGYGPNHLGRHLDWPHPDTPVPFCWEFYIGEDDISAEQDKPMETEILSIVPNPSNSTVSITYSIASISDVSMEISDVMGKRVYAKNFGELNAGIHHFSWNGETDYGKSLASGIFFIRVTGEDKSKTKKVVLMK